MFSASAIARRPLSLTGIARPWTTSPLHPHLLRRLISATVDPSEADEPTEQSTEPSSSSQEPPKKILQDKQRKLDDLPISFADISRAEVAIRGGVKRTTCEQSHFISELVGANVYFKNEFRQFTGSFKERGARNAILHLLREKKGTLRGVIAASAGNHALALAYHGKELGVPVTVVMPIVAPMSKVDKCRVRANVCMWMPF
jgi:threonine dehydratase